MPINLDDLLAPPGFAPREWQSRAPDNSKGYKGIGVAESVDLTRIVALPRRPRPSPEEEAILIERVPELLGFTKHNLNCMCAEIFEAYGMAGRSCVKSLRFIQAWSLLEIATQGGLLGLIGVGHGKTFLDLLAPWALRGKQTILLLLPPKLVKQLDRDYKILSQHHHLTSIVFHSKNAGDDVLVPGAPTLHVLPFSMLQRPSATDYIEAVIKPDAFIVDEVHKLKRADTATVGRVLRYFHANPSTAFCGWSGSLQGKSIKNYAHIAALALRHKSPLPIDPDTVEDWSRAIDPITKKDRDGEYQQPAPMGALEILCEPGEHVRSGFRRRLLDTPGVIGTKIAAVNARLQLDIRTPPAIPKTVADALAALRKKALRPDGMVYPDAMQKAAGALQISAGFYYRYRFPLVHGKPQDEALIREYLMTRSAWNSEVRKAIKSRRVNFDSERLARNAAERYHGDRPRQGKLPVWASTVYPAWRDIEDRVVVETEAIWLDDWLARDAAKWALEHSGPRNSGIVWYNMRAFGEKVAEHSGLNLHGGGPDSDALIAREKGDRSIIMSIGSHGTGRDGLQYKYHKQLIGNFPDNNELAEQLLGRLHRDGQYHDTVLGWIYTHTPELARKVNVALIQAGYVEATSDSEQKVQLGGLNFLEDEFDDEDFGEDAE